MWCGGWPDNLQLIAQHGGGTEAPLFFPPADASVIFCEPSFMGLVLNRQVRCCTAGL